MKYFQIFRSEILWCCKIWIDEEGQWNFKAWIRDWRLTLILHAFSERRKSVTLHAESSRSKGAEINAELRAERKREDRRQKGFSLF